MWIDATGGEDELGPTGIVRARGEECATDTSGVGTRSEAWAVGMVMWAF